ncbi:uncharacterized protein [Cicer arietinum]|uniref:60S acidic ribosomal protein P1-like n=1 Tax=Cicer arietinum TaxID=3827 RepID=A0A1S3DW06_CICAR|nr:60S acidic ribosomal protein P1-like [Cicer arietinum]
MSAGELACIYSILMLHNDRIAINNKSIDNLVLNAGAAGGAAVAVSAPAAAAAGGGYAVRNQHCTDFINCILYIEEAKEESDDDMGFSLFD